MGASGTGKTWTLRLLAAELRRLGFRCILFDFHGDLRPAEATTFRLSRESAFGANPLAVGSDPEGGGPDLQRVEVIEYLRRAFRLGPPEVALLAGQNRNPRRSPQPGDRRSSPLRRSRKLRALRGRRLRGLGFDGPMKGGLRSGAVDFADFLAGFFALPGDAIIQALQQRGKKLPHVPL